MYCYMYMYLLVSFMYYVYKSPKQLSRVCTCFLLALHTFHVRTYICIHVTCMYM